MTSIKKILVLSICCLLWDSSARAKKKLEIAGDYLQILLPATALFSTYLTEDRRTPPQLKTFRFVESFTYGLATVYVLKYTTCKERPETKSRTSFPSSHTFSAVSGASFIYKRFGYRYGLPAYLLAGLVGYSRVDAGAHFFDDVLAGGAIAFLFNEYFTSQSDKWTLDVGRDHLHIGFKSPLEPSPNKGRKLPLHLTLLLGPTYLQHFSFGDPKSLHTRLSVLSQKDKHIWTSSLQLGLLLSTNHKLDVLFHPYERVNSTVVATNLGVGGGLRAELIDFNWLQYDLNIEYTYRLGHWKFYEFSIGLDSLAHYSRLKFNSKDNPRGYRAEYTKFLVGLIARAKIQFTDSLGTAFQVNWSGYESSTYLKLNLYGEYQLNKRWNFLLGGQRYEKKMTFTGSQVVWGSSTLNSTVSFHTLHLGLQLSFL